MKTERKSKKETNTTNTNVFYLNSQTSNPISLNHLQTEYQNYKMFNNDIRYSLLIEINNWIHCFWNEENDLLNSITNLQVENPKFVALPDFAWKTVENKWRKLHFSLHDVYECGLGTTNKVNIPILSNAYVGLLEEKDLKEIMQNQPYINEFGNENYISQRIRNGMAAAVKLNKELVSWVIFHLNGTIGFLRTKEEYRNTGIASNLMNWFIKYLLKLNIRPICHVSPYNAKSIAVVKKFRMKKISEVAWVRERTEIEKLMILKGDL